MGSPSQTRLHSVLSQISSKFHVQADPHLGELPERLSVQLVLPAPPASSYLWEGVCKAIDASAGFWLGGHWARTPWTAFVSKTSVPRWLCCSRFHVLPSLI